MKLPNAERAVIKLEKLRDYSLNPLHEAGKHKARVFQAALALTVGDAEWLCETLLEAVQREDAFAGSPSTFGEKYVVDVWIEHKTYRAKIRTAWIIEYGTDFPRLTSCYVL